MTDEYSDKDNTDGKIACRICGARVHIIVQHLAKEHPDVTMEQYRQRFPDAPEMSAIALARLEDQRKQKAQVVVNQETNTVMESKSIGEFKVKTGKRHEVFDLGNVPAAMRSTNGSALEIDTFESPQYLSAFLAEKDSGYVFPIDVLKNVLMGLFLNTPVYLWGHAGTGKSTIFEQVAAHTGRPWIRVQHTRNTEEAHVLGQWLVKSVNGVSQTEFELGPLPYAMKHGLIYLADEYDFAMPSVTALYQPVLEGKPLVIKDADEQNRVIRPHPMFRIVATGNTNGTGDDTGLYAGTLIQNAANYERFGVVCEVKYISRETEILVVMNQAKVPKELKPQVVKMIDFATRMREQFGEGKIGSPPSPRAMINAGKIALVTGSWNKGIQLAFLNRLSSEDRIAGTEVLQRMAIDAA